MGFRFRRRMRILPGVRLNIGKTGVSTSIGGRGAWITLRPGHKARATVGLPGTGISYTQGGQVQRAQPVQPAPAGNAVRGWIWIGLIILGAVWWYFTQAS